MPTLPPSIRASSIELPPMSQTIPRAPGQPKSTPCADSRASSAPSITQSFNPVLASTWARNSGPSTASRTAAVATQVRGAMFIPSASTANRFRATSARSLPRGFR